MIHLISQTPNTTATASATESSTGFPVFSLLQILLAASVALVPPLYPRLSRYKRRSEKGIERLEQPILVMGDIIKGTLEDDDPGFTEVVTAIENHYPLSGEVKRLNVLRGEPDSLRSELDIEFGSMVGPNAVLYVDYKTEADRDMDIITFHPFDPAQTLKLTELRRWVRTTTTERSHYATMVVAVLWTAISVAEVL